MTKLVRLPRVAHDRAQADLRVLRLVDGNEPDYVTVAQELGRRLAADGITLVYGGGGINMWCARRCASRPGGVGVIGVIPVGLFRKEIGHEGLTDLVEVQSMHERKQLMHDLADAFYCPAGRARHPGGAGRGAHVNLSGSWSKPVALLTSAGSGMASSSG